MEFTIDLNIPEAISGLNELAYRQVPFATSLAVNNVAKIGRAEQTKGIFERFHVNNDAFLKRSTRFQPGNKRNPAAVLEIRDSFLIQHEDGQGVERKPGDVYESIVQPIDPSQRRIGVYRGRKLRGKNTPKAILRRHRNKKIGRPKGKRSGTRRKAPTPFIATMRSGKKGVFLREGPLSLPIELIFSFERVQKLGKKRLKFRTTVYDVAAREWEKEFGAALARAYATAK